jgi:hypothetical protein
VGYCLVEHPIDASIGALLMAPGFDIFGWKTMRGDIRRFHGTGPGGSKSADYDETYKGRQIT